MTTDATRKRLLLAGDVQGDLSKLYAQVENQQKRVGSFDALVAVGAFLPGLGEGVTGEAAKAAAAALAEYVAGKRKAPIETYFIESRSAALLQAAPDGKVLCEGVNFLGGFGIREICGLRVAYLSGRYDPAIFKAAEAEEAGPAFVGPAYTPQAIEGLIRLAREGGALPIDLLLTAEWPARLEEKLEEAERPKHPDGGQLNWQTLGAPPVAELCAALSPRYHIFGTNDIFYQRPPFQTPTGGHVCRCIALGKVGSKGKARLPYHGLALSPAATMTESALRQRPENTTPMPFQIAGAATGGGLKRKMEAKDEAKEEAKMEPQEGEEGAVIPDQIFLGRLPPNIQEDRLQKAFKHCGKIERIHLARDESEEGKPCKGFGWITFSTPEEAAAACELSDLLECGGRKISICLSKPRTRKEGERKERKVQIVIEPHADCWFCLVNPKVEKHMIVTATTEVYVATAKGPVNPAHVQVLPVKHAPCYAACPPELQQALKAHCAAIRRMCHEAGQECLIWERWIPMGISAANHMQIQVIPISVQVAGGAREALEAVTKSALSGAALKRIADHDEVLDHLNDDSATPYIYFEIPGDNTAKGRQVERYVYAGLSSGPRIPLNFGRQVACELLDCQGKVDWRSCQEDKDSEKELALAFRDKFLKYQPKGK